jgi:hypothetical protein
MWLLNLNLHWGVSHCSESSVVEVREVGHDGLILDSWMTNLIHNQTIVTLGYILAKVRYCIILLCLTSISL